MKVASRLAQLLRPLWPKMALSGLFRILNQALGVALPAVGVVAVARALAGDGPSTLIWAMVAMAVAKGVFRYLEQFTGHAVAFRLLSTLRTQVYWAIEPLAPGGLGGERSGDLVSRITADIDRVEPFYAHTIAPLLSAVGVPTLVLAALSVLDPALAWTLAPFVVAALVVVPLVGRGASQALTERARRQAGELSAELTEGVQGVREVLMFGAGARRAGALRRHGKLRAATSASRAWLQAGRRTVSELLAGAALVAVVIVGLDLLAEGSIDVAGFGVAVALALGVFTPLRAIEELAPDLEEALSAATRLFELMDREPVVTDPEHPVAPTGRGSVELESVTFRYPGTDAVVAKDLSLDIPEGARVALVGSSGSGKSTIASLLVRWWDPSRGTIRVGGVDVRSLRQEDLRRQVTLVSQRPHLFAISIAANVRLGAPGAGDGEIEELLTELGLGPLVEGLPAGIHTEVGELGRSLSGGQRQRVAIARALLDPSPILVLDEATSELDVDTERRVLSAVVRRAASRTVLIIAHRLTTVRDADEIVVLEGGEVVERGSRERLLELGGRYAALEARERDLIAP